MPDSYNHGVRVIETKTQGGVLRTIATSILGFVVTSADADDVAFPNGVPVGRALRAIPAASMGVDGTFADVVEAIGNQSNAIANIVRVDPTGLDEEELEDAIVAAVKALRTAEAVTTFKSRAIGAPFLDTEPVVIELALTAKKLRGMAYASTRGAVAYPDSSVAQLITYRNKFSARELMLIHGDFTAAGQPVNAIATALGLRARIDNEYGWNKTLSNIVVDGVTGIERPLFFDLQDSATDVGALNEAGVTCLVYHSGGFRFWGSRTCSADQDFVFESATRTAQVIADTCARGVAWANDLPITPSLGRDLIGMINKFIRRMTPNQIAGGECMLADGNTQESLSAGSLKLKTRYTPTPPLEDLTLFQEITSDFLGDFEAQVGAA